MIGALQRGVIAFHKFISIHVHMERDINLPLFITAHVIVLNGNSGDILVN